MLFHDSERLSAQTLLPPALCDRSYDRHYMRPCVFESGDPRTQDEATPNLIGRLQDIPCSASSTSEGPA